MVGLTPPTAPVSPGRTAPGATGTQHTRDPATRSPTGTIYPTVYGTQWVWGEGELGVR